MFGSLMFIIYGTGRYWRFIIPGIALVVFIYIGYKVSAKAAKKGRKR